MERGAVIPCREKSGPMEVLGGGASSRGQDCEGAGMSSPGSLEFSLAFKDPGPDIGCFCK